MRPAFVLVACCPLLIAADLPTGAVARIGTASAKADAPGEIHSLDFLSETSLFVGTASGWTAYDVQTQKAKLPKPVGGPAFTVVRDAEKIFIGSVKKVHEIAPVESARLEPARSWETGEEAVVALALAPGGRRLVYAAGDQRLAVLETRTGTVTGHATLSGPPVAAGLTANGRILGVVTRDGTARVHGLAADGKLETLWTRRVARASRIAAGFSPDGRVFAASSAGRVMLIEAVAGRPMHSLERRFGEGDVRALAFSADGKLIAAGTNGPDAVVRVWDVTTGTELGSFAGHLGDVSALAFSPSGRVLASAGTDTSVLLWRVPESKLPTDPLPLGEAWDALDSMDGPVAYRAAGALLVDPVRGAAIIRDGVLTAAGTEQKVRKWIADLDHDEFRVREGARTALLKAGLRAAPALTDPSRKKLGAEGEERIRQILDEFENQSLRIPESGFFGEPLRAVRGIRALECAGGREAKAALEAIAAMKGETRATNEARAALANWPPEK
jgi:WD40 repeat protein